MARAGGTAPAGTAVPRIRLRARRVDGIVWLPTRETRPGAAAPGTGKLSQDVGAVVLCLRAREPAGVARPAVARARAALVAELDGTPAPGTDGRVSLHAVDVAVWLAGLLDDLQQIREPG